MAQRKLVATRPRTYGGYLKLHELLQLQRPGDTQDRHDELLFIIAHQTYELWFKHILYELESSVGAMEDGDAREASRLLERVVEVFGVLTQQLKVLETIKPSDFMKFRDSLRPASGFQSVQFREIEYISGQRDPRFLDLHKDDPNATKALQARLAAPSLWDAFVGLMVRRRLLAKPGRRPSVAKEVTAVAAAYKGDATADIGALADALLEYDEAFWLWRNHHVGMVERIIGRKVGTGAASVGETLGPYSFQRSGVAYLKTTLRRRFFPALWAARTKMGKD
jgi:tryptophan 2,3-dioxygenase